MHQRDREKEQNEKKRYKRILEEFRGIKSTSCIKSGRKRTLIPKVKNDKGETITSRKGIANVFGELYSKLQAENHFGQEVQNLQKETRRNTKKKSYNEEVRNEMPEFTQKEVQAAIDSLKKGKASDNNGIRAEDIKTCDETTKEILRQIFNEVLKQEECTPET